MKKELLESIKEYFKKNPNINAVYVTSDENIFNAEHYASNWKHGLTDKTVTPVTRVEALGLEETKPVAEGENGGKGGNETNGGNGGADAEREVAVRRYVELFDTKPSHFMKLETILGKIAEKEAEVKSAEEKAAASETSNEGGDQQ